MSNSAMAKEDANSGTNRRRSKKSQVDGTGTQQVSSANTEQGAQIIPMPQIRLEETPTQETSQTSLPLPGNRPIDESNLEVVGTISVMGARPVFASSLQVADTITASGERPIAVSSIQISETEMIMGNRPIASNNIEADEDVMSYLD